MKYYIAFLTSVLTAVSAGLIPPNYNPSDDLYYIFNVAFSDRVLDNQGSIDPGHVIGTFPHTDSRNLEWFVKGVHFGGDPGINATIRSRAAIEGDLNVGGFISPNGTAIVQSATAVSWQIRPVANTSEQFMIVTNNIALTALNGTSLGQRPLAAQSIDDTDTSQYWVLVPKHQFLDYVAKNNL